MQCDRAGDHGDGECESDEEHREQDRDSLSHLTTPRGIFFASGSQQQAFRFPLLDQTNG